MHDFIIVTCDYTKKRGVNEAKLPVSSLGFGSIKLDSCAIRLLNELFVDTKL
jgi:hypothetical protein